MFNLLKNEYNRFLIKQFRKAYTKNSEEQGFKDVIIEKASQMGWNKFLFMLDNFLENWRVYYYQNLDTIDEKLEKLYKNLDEKSIEYAKILFNRNIFILPNKNQQDFLMMNTKILYTQEEQDELAKLKKINTNYKLANNKQVENYTELYKSGFSFVEEFAQNYVSGKTFIDGGAYIGDTAVVFEKYNPANIYCFEPNKTNENLLHETARLNNLENKIIIVPKGLSDCEKTIYFRAKDKNIDSGGNLCEDKTDLCVETTTIDKCVSANNLEIGLIKLDVEGAEYEAILGAKETILKHKPVLLISVYHSLKDFLEIKPLIEEWTTDYKFIIRPTFPLMLNAEFMLIAYPAVLENKKVG